MSNTTKFPTPGAQYPPPPPAAVPESKLIDINSLSVHPQYPFTSSSPNLTFLSKDIAQNGLVQPLTVRLTGSDKYQIISGTQRYYACLDLGLSKVACNVFSSLGDDQAALMMLSSVVNQRRNISPCQMARIAKSMMDAHCHQGRKFYNENELPTRSCTFTSRSLNITENAVYAYTRCASLDSSLFFLLDSNALSISAGSILSELPLEEQTLLGNFLKEADNAKLPCKIAKQLVIMSKHTPLTMDIIKDVLAPLVTPSIDIHSKPVTLEFNPEDLAPYLNIETDPKKLTAQLLNLLHQYCPLRAPLSKPAPETQKVQPAAV